MSAVSVSSGMLNAGDSDSLPLNNSCRTTAVWGCSACVRSFLFFAARFPLRRTVGVSFSRLKSPTFRLTFPPQTPLHVFKDLWILTHCWSNCDGSLRRRSETTGSIV